MSLTVIKSLEGEKKIFHELDVHHVQKVGIKRFLTQEAEMSLTRHQPPRIGEKNLFHELDVHHVQKVGIKRFWAQKAELNLTATSLFKQAR